MITNFGFRIEERHRAQGAGRRAQGSADGILGTEAMESRVREVREMKFTPHPDLPEVIIIEPKVFEDQRGHFFENYRAEGYLENGVPKRFVQDNLSSSTRGVLRGLHYQLGRPQGKLVWVVYGEVFDVAVDIRRGSPTFGQLIGLTLSAENYRQIYIPEGFAHGFCVTSDRAIFIYKCTDYYAPKEERGILWADPALGIDWPITNTILSDKDREYPTLADIPSDELPIYSAHKRDLRIEL